MITGFGSGAPTLPNFFFFSLVFFFLSQNCSATKKVSPSMSTRPVLGKEKEVEFKLREWMKLWVAVPREQCQIMELCTPPRLASLMESLLKKKRQQFLNSKLKSSRHCCRRRRVTTRGRGKGGRNLAASRDSVVQFLYDCRHEFHVNTLFQPDDVLFSSVVEFEKNQNHVEKNEKRRRDAVVATLLVLEKNTRDLAAVVVVATEVVAVTGGGGEEVKRREQAKKNEERGFSFLILPKMDGTRVGEKKEFLGDDDDDDDDDQMSDQRQKELAREEREEEEEEGGGTEAEVEEEEEEEEEEEDWIDVSLEMEDLNLTEVLR